VLDSADLISMFVFVAVFLGTNAVVLLVFLRFDRDKQRTRTRLRDLGPSPDVLTSPAGLSDLALSALPRVGAFLVPIREQERAQLQARLHQAGFYGPQTLRVYLGAKLLALVALPLLAGLVPFAGGWLGLKGALVAGAVAAGLTLIAPSVWLDHRRRQRQNALRQALPDALDMFVLCLEGGLSVLATIQRVTGEMQLAHPLFGAEMNIVQREIQLGLSAGDAFKKLGDRSDLEEIRNLASVLLQSERFGASVVKALRLHADGCRDERQQRAEELAQKAAVKILFPTLLCIFPAIFIVILGPAAYQLASMFSQIKN
jgi:tight adherence protein C